MPTETRATAKIGRRRKGVKRSKKDRSMEEQLETAGEYPDLIEDIMQVRWVCLRVYLLKNMLETV